MRRAPRSTRWPAGEWSLVTWCGSSRRILLWQCAHFADPAGAAAVPHILQLDRDAIGIGEVELRRSFFGASGFGAAHPDARGERSGVGAFRFLDSQLRERPHRPVGIEVVDGDADVVDARFLGAAGAQRDEPRALADAKNRDRTLPGDYRQAEHALVELERSLGIADGERDVIHLARDERGLAAG